MGSTQQNCCHISTSTCTDKIDYVSASEGGPGAGVGALYYTIAKKFSAGTRVGDAYKNGKTEYKGTFGNGLMSEFYINCLYGDPTLKIKTMW